MKNESQFENGHMPIKESFCSNVIKNSLDWIKCSDRCPEIDKEVIFLASLKTYFSWEGDKKFHQNKLLIGSLDDRGNICYVYGDGWTPFTIEDVTHWMPLPNLPKEKNENHTA